MCFFAATEASNEDQAGDAAKDLYAMGLLKGNADTFSVEALELTRPASRVEIAITITRLLGKESKAIYQQNPHPFSDVPDWADAHIGWLYENYLVNGTSDTVFGSYDTATTRQFCTMLLRVLGYSDSKGDFSYENAKEFAVSIGLINTQQAQRETLYRSDMVLISRAALNMPLKKASRTLAQKLREDRALSQEQYNILNAAAKTAFEKFFEAYPQTLASGRAYYDDNKIVLEMEENIGSYGLRVFYTSNLNPVPIELPIENASLGFKKRTSVSPFKWCENVTTFDIYGLEKQQNVKFVVVDSSSESTLYKINRVSPEIPTKNASEWESYRVSLKDFFEGQRVNVSGGKILRDNNGVTVITNSPVTYYGLRVVYTSDQTTYPQELPLNDKTKGFTRGAPDWSVDGRIHEIYLHGLDDETNIQVCLVETSSEGNIYKTYGISPVITER